MVSVSIKRKKSKLKSGTVKLTARIQPSCACELHMLKLVLTRFISDGLIFSRKLGVFRQACKNMFSLNAELTEQETGASLKVV